ncbi:MAG: hypothetical protein NC078_03885 [Ruminococcus sp.]|nr:hypothetical protein [Ruminococcus sp.]
MNFDFSQMFSTPGNTLFYGGIIGAAVSVILLTVLTPLFGAAKKKIAKKIDDEFKENGE